MSEPRNFFFVLYYCVILVFVWVISKILFFFFGSFCSLWCKNDIGMSSVKCPCSFVAFVFDWVISKIFFCCCSFCSLWSKNDIGRSSVKCPCSFVVKHRWARYVVCFFFFLIPWKCLVENFLFVRKPKKSGGKRGRAGGGGILCSA